MIIKELAQLLEPPNKDFEGHLLLSDQKIIWTLSYVQGRLIYAIDGLHPVRRWNRILNQHFPKFHLDIDTAQLTAQPYWQLSLLDQGFKKQQLSLVRAKLMLRDIIQECLFELSQCTSLTREWQAASLPMSRYCKTISLSQWEIKMTIENVKEMQKEWQSLGLTDFVPTLSPTLKQSLDLQHSPVPYEYITGRYTLWNIATKLGKPIGVIVKSLLPLIQAEALELKIISDLSLSDIQLSPLLTLAGPANYIAVEIPRALKTTPPSPIPPSPISPSPIPPSPIPPSPIPTKSTESPAVAVTVAASPKPEVVLSNDDPSGPLIACIDDSPVLAHSLKKILSTGGYRTLIIQEPMQGFSQLIEHIPSLILLDVMLPHADGYSVCRFLRDTPVFRHTPIIILTGRSKPVDRARASIAGATEFLVKPPEPEELLHMIDKHLGKGEKISGEQGYDNNPGNN
ncbi:MAG: response regulator [Cyanobacteria bacterium P01_B01_bin.77]